MHLDPKRFAAYSCGAPACLEKDVDPAAVGAIASASLPLPKQPRLAPTLAYARRVSALGRPIWIRFVLVPGLTDDWDNVERRADVCAELKSAERVEILRFHQMGRDKWHRLGLEYPLEDALPPDAALTERVREQFRSRGLTVY